MLWGPEDWDAWALRVGDGEAVAAPLEAAIRSRLEDLPGRRGMTVADLGCGHGRWVPFLARHFASVVAVDYAPGRLALARRAFSGANVTYRRRDLRDLTPFRNRFDVALALDSIVGPRLRDVDRVLSQIRASLREGGLLLATFPAAPRSGAPTPMALDPAAPVPLRFHEVEVQYRLRRARFTGVRIRRVRGDDSGPGRLMCTATRRGDN